MIAVISPAKTLDFETVHQAEFTIPRFPKETGRLVKTLQKKKGKDLRALMGISENIAQLNVERYQKFTGTDDPQSTRPAVYAFKGDVYLGLAAETLNNNEIDFAQNNLRILSGLYGLLRPLDLIEPYRLEMGTKLKVGRYDNLYRFWGEKIAKLVSQELKEQGDDVLINLASKEYFKSVPRKKMKARIVDVEFKDFHNDQYKVISFFAKKARGLMSRYIIQNGITEPEALKGFTSENYYYVEKESDENKMVFYRG